MALFEYLTVVNFCSVVCVFHSSFYLNFAGVKREQQNFFMSFFQVFDITRLI